ncbi:hypothetical protein, partial [Mesorhizobium sp. M4A.F.Ca.ET.020.02.1.1]|uniref:hypothetical protein n=1 Tax=Mesorhizobium sp. M4A.F.Ca.ET.020.02.1.1 TaxID=2496652 RepID=UPI001AECC0E7
MLDHWRGRPHGEPTFLRLTEFSQSAEKWLIYSISTQLDFARRRSRRESPEEVTIERVFDEPIGLQTKRPAGRWRAAAIELAIEQRSG